MDMFQTSCGEDQNRHFMFNIFSPEILAVYEIMWKNAAHALSILDN